MPLSFHSFFSSAKTPTDGLVQAQREAIADALHYLIYADNHIASSEGEFMSDTIEGLAWEAGLSFSSYETRSIANARRAKEDATYRREFFASLAARLDSAESRARALALAKALVQADGATSVRESAELAELQSVLRG